MLDFATSATPSSPSTPSEHQEGLQVTLPYEIDYEPLCSGCYLLIDIALEGCVSKQAYILPRQVHGQEYPCLVVFDKDLYSTCAVTGIEGTYFELKTTTHHITPTF